MPAKYVLDTSAFINGWRHHYRGPRFEWVWRDIAAAMQSGIIVSPTEVHVELERKAGDDLCTWATDFKDSFLPPVPSWFNRWDDLRAYAPHWFDGVGKHDADPFVVGLATASGLPVVTYEGTTFSGEPARVSTLKRSMPIVCASIAVPVATMADVLNDLGH